MSKRIVVGLDPSDHSRTALEVACLGARAYDGVVVGVAVVDLPGIDRAANLATLAPPGVTEQIRRAREYLLTEARDMVARLGASFEETCRAHEVRHELEEHTSAPVDAIVDVARSADLIVVGTRTWFHFETEEEPGDTLRRLLRARICPVLAVPRELDLPPQNVVFPYDGSSAAARAMRVFTYLTAELPLTREVDLLCVDDDREAALALLERPTTYLEEYGYHVTSRVTAGDPREVVLAESKAKMPGVVVLGAHGRGPIRERLFGSVAKTLIDDGTVPLFLAW